MVGMVLSAIVGPGGRFVPEYGTLRAAVCEGLFCSYYKQRKRMLSESSVRNLVSGAARPPRWLIQYYAGDEGYKQLYRDVEDYVYACTSLHRLKYIVRDVHDIVCTCSVDVSRFCHSERDGLTREAVAEYLADVLYYSLKEPLAS